MLIGRKNVALVGGGWKIPYITDGLVAMWDGDHLPPTELSWDDVTAGRRLVFPAGAEAVAGGVRLTPAQYGECSMPDAVSAILNGSFTVEVVAKYHHTRLYGGTVSFGTTSDTSSSRLLNIWSGSGARPFANSAYRSTSYSDGDNSVIPLDTFVCLALVARGSQAEIWVNNALVGTVSSGTVTTPTTQTFSLNRAITVDRGGNETTFCQCRQYSRALTPAEIAANYAVDKARFNLP